MTTAPAPKKRKTDSGGSFSLAAPSSDKLMQGGIADAARVDPKVLQAKKFAITQAQQEGCLGNYRSFDSPFGNYLVPVVPTHADLFGP